MSGLAASALRHWPAVGRAALAALPTVAGAEPAADAAELAEPSVGLLPEREVISHDHFAQAGNQEKVSEAGGVPDGHWMLPMRPPL